MCQVILTISNNIKAHKNCRWLGLVRIEDDEEFYILGSNESFVFTLKNGENTVIQKTLTSADYDETENGYILSLTSAEMNIPVGTYNYSINLCRSDGETEPVIPKSKFIVTEE